MNSAQSSNVPARNPGSGQISMAAAVSIGIGGMVGAGIFSILGVVAHVAGNAMWLAFAIGGVVALLSTYSYAKLGATFPSAGGAVHFLVKSFGDGIFAGGPNLFMWAGYIISLALYATAFGAYALFTIDDPILAVVVAIAGLGVVGRFALTHWIGVGTVYVVTNRRVMSVGLGSDVSLKWMSGRELKSVTFKVRSDGSGDLMFERHLTKVEQRVEDERDGLFSDRNSSDLERVLDNPAAETFVGVPDVEAVFELVRRTFIPPAT